MMTLRLLILGIVIVLNITNVNCFWNIGKDSINKQSSSSTSSSSSSSTPVLTSSSRNNDDYSSSSWYLSDTDIVLNTNGKYDNNDREIDRDRNLAKTTTHSGGRIGGSAYASAVSNSLSIEEERQRRRYARMPWLEQLPKLNFRMDPVINFKLKQKITQFGACITLGMDYMSDLRQWRTYCAVEDAIFRGRFSLRGSELGWTKSWIWNLGVGEDSTAKFKLRMGLNLKTYKVYARLRFRTEPINPFDIGEGLSCAGKIPLPGVLPILRTVPLRIEYRLRINTPLPEFGLKKNQRTGSVSLSTGIDRVDMSLDELNFCLEWDEDSPLWGIGLVRSDISRSRMSNSDNKIDKTIRIPSKSVTSKRGTNDRLNQIVL